jgi:nucleoside-diphosphate-sugar epimerase
MSKKKATILGGMGFIGRHLAGRLLAAGWDCDVPDRQSSPDLLDNMGHVFYCAGLTADYSLRPFATVEAHVSLLNRILKADRFESLVYLSSTRLYDSLPVDSGKEDLALLLNPLNPRHIYDLSKALGESLCVVAGQGRARVARLSCVFNDHTDAEGFLPGLLRQIIVERPSHLQVDSSPFFTRDYIHLQDVLEALIYIAVEGTGPIYNVAGGRNISNDVLFTTLSRISGCEIVPLRHDTAPPPPVINIQKMQDAFGWQPEPVLQRVETIIKENLRC